MGTSGGDQSTALLGSPAKPDPMGETMEEEKGNTTKHRGRHLGLGWLVIRVLNYRQLSVGSLLAVM